MKKIYLLFVLLTCLFLLSACSGDKECVIECEDMAIMLGDSQAILPSSSAKNPKYEYSVSGSAIEINDGIISTKEVGVCEVTISVKDYVGSKTIKVYVGEMGIKVIGDSKLIIENTMELKVLYFGIDSETRVTWRSTNNDIIRVANGTVTGIDFGTAKINAKCGEYSDSFEVEVVRPAIETINCSDTLMVEENGNYDIKYEVSPHYASSEVRIEASNDCVSINEDNIVHMNKKGTCVIKLISKTNEQVFKEIALTIVEAEAPKFNQTSEYKEKLEINYGEEYDLLQGLTLTDNVDTDIEIEYDKDLVCAYGENLVTITAKDDAGNTATFERTVVMNWQYKTKFIGHSGCYYGVPNTEEAFLFAAKELHYQAIECDLHVTKDGVFVTNHDSYIMDGDTKYIITQTKYEDLVKLTLTSGSYTGHICTFERYLEICKQYGCEAIVELKYTTGINDSDQSNMAKLVEFIKEHGMWDKTVFLTSTRPLVKWIRNHGYNDVAIQYLVQGADVDEILNFCIQYNCDISVNVTYGQLLSDVYSISDEYIKKYHDAGLKISTWTFSGKYEQVQEWIDKGVEYVTCDIHYMDKLELK